MNLQDRIDPTVSEQKPVEPTAPVGGWEEKYNEMYGSFLFAPVINKAGYDKLRDFIHQTIKNREREIAEGLVDYLDKVCQQNIGKEVMTHEQFMGLLALINKQ